MTPCQHMQFSAVVKVARMEDTGTFMAEVQVTCAECREPFQFLGLPPGLNMGGAAVSVDGLTALIAIAPDSRSMNPLTQMAVALKGPRQ